MTVAECLHTMGRTTARQIAEKLGINIELVYHSLVSMEARGEARVEVTHEKMPRRALFVEWVSMRETEVA